MEKLPPPQASDVRHVTGKVESDNEYINGTTMTCIIDIEQSTNQSINGENSQWWEYINENTQ